MHEIGHALGLEHVRDKQSIMYPTYQLKQRSDVLTFVDQQSIQALYGKKTEEHFRSDIRHGQVFGNPLGGVQFNIVTESVALNNSHRLYEIKVQCQEGLLESMRMYYSDPPAETSTHRGTFISLYDTDTFTLNKNEEISIVQVKTGTYHGMKLILGIQFITNSGRMSQQMCGTNITGTTSTEKFNGYILKYISGRSGDLIDSLQFHWRQENSDIAPPPTTKNQTTGLIKVFNASGNAVKCLDVPYGIGNNHVGIQLFRCHGEGNQQFTLHDNGQISVLGKCLDVPDSSSVDLVQIQLFDCHNRANQHFTIDDQNRIRIFDKCLDVPRADIIDRNIIQLFRCHNGSNQNFTFVPID
ncbi:unnamed protein product [Didymodactylos carnosus]|uniref:Jacalin-type lectin domain-containing protein n=2 Tax=Didymodactylos carnosus TaxID=1234261 RepID=A0A813UPX4_9BILA|nr:unnamed protein product [Didymodactylos carnosus]CAF3616084.1 unnamed protein product [Didymodactylos carnosus]